MTEATPLASATPANGEQVERADEEDINELDGFLAAYSSEPDGDLVNRIENDDLLTWGILRRLLASVRATPTEDARSRVKVLEEALREAHDTLHECTAVLTADDCAKVAAVMSRARTALGNKETDRHG